MLKIIQLDISSHVVDHIETNGHVADLSVTNYGIKHVGSIRQQEENANKSPRGIKCEKARKHDK